MPNVTVEKKMKLRRKAGSFFSRQVGPALKDADSSVRNASREAERVIGTAEGAGSRLIRRAAIAGGLSVAGGVTGAEAGKQVVRRISGDNKVSKADPDYPYLPSTLRADLTDGFGGVPRTNPISPLQMLASSNIVADGYLKVRSRWPVGRAKRTKNGMYEIAQGTQMGFQPLGFGRGPQ